MKILVVDDDKNIRLTLKGVLEDENYICETVKTGEEAVDYVEKEKFDVIFLDVKLPGIDGIEVLRKIKNKFPDTYIIMISGHSDFETAVEATKLGAYNFIEKPLKADKIILELKNIESRKKLEYDLKRLKEVTEGEGEIIGDSEAIRKLKKDIKLAAPSESRVMIFGENGTGKELAARAVHFNSRRKNKPFVKINCAALPKDLIESELFGYEKGAFTGAVSRKIGRIEEADTGTLFLDEVGDMSLDTQAKLLRVLEENEFVRLGGNNTIKFDIRIISATNKDLETEIKNGNFREDLYFRLKVIPITVPPLRERKEDIPVLVWHFSKVFAVKNGKRVKKFSDDALNLFKEYNWKGNVRELKNLVERTIIMVDKDVISSEDIRIMIPTATGTEITQNTGSVRDGDDFKEIMDNFQKEVLIEKYNEFDGNISKMARSLKMDRANLHRKLKKYGIK